MICQYCNYKLPDDSEFCQYCGKKIEPAIEPTIEPIEPTVEVPVQELEKTEELIVEDAPIVSTPEPLPVEHIALTPASETYSAPPKSYKSATEHKKGPNNNLVFFTNIASVVLAIIAMFSIIIAMNLQDARRNNFENWNTTAVYFVLLLVLGVFLGFAVSSLIKDRFKLIACLSPIVLITMMITWAEYSIMDYGYFTNGYYELYLNCDVVEVFNFICIFCVIALFVSTLIPVAVVLSQKIKVQWHRSISYREKCYKRAAKIHKYLEKGIISEEEYERTKNDILKHIQ